MERWVSEVNAGWGLTVKVKEQLCDIQSKFQHIEIFETVNLGKLLMLDGIVQLTSYDEFAYHEMMAHLPYYTHPCPEKVLVIGGGDGGVLRELAKHPELKELHICEIDAEVIAACRQFLPETACGFDDLRVAIHIGDGSKFVREHKNEFDIIIVDSTDPGGPGEPLFGEEFYLDLKAALRPGGVIASQSESPYLLPDIVLRLNTLTNKIFKFADYAIMQVPTYPTGQIGMCIASDARDVHSQAAEVPEEESAE
jgi:spermidine synthase